MVPGNDGIGEPIRLQCPLSLDYKRIEVLLNQINLFLDDLGSSLISLAAE